MKYGPFSALLSSTPGDGGQAAWTINNGVAVANVPSDGRTDFLVCSPQSVSVPAGSTIKEVTLELSPDPGGQGFNLSEGYYNDVEGSASPPGMKVEDASLTPAVVNNPNTKFKVSLYTSSGSQITVNNAKMFVKTN